LSLSVSPLIAGKSAVAVSRLARTKSAMKHLFSSADQA
jgi:hypothetical protein